MPETLALSRIALAKSRFLLLVIVAALGIGEFIALLAVPLHPELGRDLAIGVLFCALMSAGLASIVLFDYGDNGDMNLPESGCSHWLLRMPIDAWKIAIVPVMLRTLWICGLWMLFIGVAHYFGFEEKIPLVGPPIGFSAAAIWVLVISWRPFRSGWRRIAAITLAVPTLYCCVGAVLVAPYIDRIQWRPFAIAASNAVAITIYVVAVVVAIRSIKLARICSEGIIPEFGKEIASESSSAGQDNVQHFPSARRALAWHDLIKSRDWIRRTIVVGVIPAIIGLSLLVPLRVDAVVSVLVGFAYLGLFAACRTGETLENATTIPPYLAASPLSTATIAWTRCLTPIIIAACVFSCVLLVFAGWACWPENRMTWFNWAADRAASLGESADATTIGVRWSIAIVLGSAVLMLGRIVSLLWIGMAGRSWVAIVVAVVVGLVFLVPLGIVLRWFIQQTDWESTKASAIGYLEFAPYLVAAILAAKGLAVAASTVVLVRSRLVSTGATFSVFSIWIVVTLSISLALFILIPDPRATWVWCLAITSLSLPLARILIQPLALGWNRHR